MNLLSATQTQTIPMPNASFSTHQLIYPSPLGELIITGNADAVHSILFSSTLMPEGWQNDFPYPSISEDSEDTVRTSADADIPEPLRLCYRQLLEYFRGERQTFDFPYVVEGTPFQRAVWNELAAVPYAESRSYKQLAVAIGSERAVRAVGSANGRNKLSIVLPCHRIIGSSGKLTGYAGGLWRKEWLLQHEARFAK